MRKSILARMIDFVADSRVSPVIIGIGIAVLLYVFVALPLAALKLKFLRFVISALYKMKIFI